MRLAGKTAVITGAAGDIGSASAKRFAGEGAKLALLDRDEDALKSAIMGIDPAPIIMAADITDEALMGETARTIEGKLGKIDILFANAGVEQNNALVADLPASELDRVLSVNLAGAFVTARQFLPVMADGASIIFTSSIAGAIGFPALSAYCASKSGVLGLMRALSIEAADRGIRSNAIMPGSVRSTMLGRSAKAAMGEEADTEHFFDTLAGMTRLGKLVVPDDVAALALFLAGDDSRMITGQSIAVDGGTIF